MFQEEISLLSLGKQTFFKEIDLKCFIKIKRLKKKASSQRVAAKLSKKASAWKFQCHPALTKKDTNSKKEGE